MGMQSVFYVMCVDTSTDEYKATVDSAPVSQEEVKNVLVCFLWWILVQPAGAKGNDISPISETDKKDNVDTVTTVDVLPLEKPKSVVATVFTVIPRRLHVVLVSGIIISLSRNGYQSWFDSILLIRQIQEGVLFV